MSSWKSRGVIQSSHLICLVQPGLVLWYYANKNLNSGFMQVNSRKWNRKYVNSSVSNFLLITYTTALNPGLCQRAISLPGFPAMALQPTPVLGAHSSFCSPPRVRPPFLSPPIDLNPSFSSILDPQTHSHHHFYLWFQELICIHKCHVLC